MRSYGCTGHLKHNSSAVEYNVYLHGTNLKEKNFTIAVILFIKLDQQSGKGLAGTSTQLLPEEQLLPLQFSDMRHQIPADSRDLVCFNRVGL
jgi:hypothetical protein